MCDELRVSSLRLPTKVSALVFLAAISLFGCDRESARLSRQTTTIAEVPDDVMNAARQAIPGVEFSDAWKNVEKDGKLHSYEIRGRTKNGKIREARVSPSGEILEME
jgi:hypothetical protein